MKKIEVLISGDAKKYPIGSMHRFQMIEHKIVEHKKSIYGGCIKLVLEVPN